MTTQKLTLIRGDSPQLQFTFTSNGSPVDLTDYEAFFTLTAQDNPSDDTLAVIKKSVTPIPNASQGIVYFQLDNTDTNNLDPNTTYYWDVQLKYTPDNYIFTPIIGVCTVLTDYTRRTS